LETGSRSICPGWAGTTILLISASQITGEPPAFSLYHFIAPKSFNLIFLMTMIVAIRKVRLYANLSSTKQKTTR
jgi:hypothetical protein